MLVKCERNRMVQTTRNFVLFDKKNWVFKKSFLTKTNKQTKNKTKQKQNKTKHKKQTKKNKKQKQKKKQKKKKKKRKTRFFPQPFLTPFWKTFL